MFFFLIDTSTIGYVCFWNFSIASALSLNVYGFALSHMRYLPDLSVKYFISPFGNMYPDFNEPDTVTSIASFCSILFFLQHVLKFKPCYNLPYVVN